jgi:small-conductance mechanosensitive channel
MPDLYVYEFNKNQIADEIDLGMKDDELGKFFSDFMMGEKASFDLFTEYRDREQDVFGTMEQINMENARRLLNDTIFILGGALALAAAGCSIYLVKKRKYELRSAYKGAILVYTVMMATLFIAFNIDQSKEFMYNRIFINQFGTDDVLPLMLTEQFAQMSLIASAAISLIVLVILASVIWRLTKPRRMFWQ